MGIKPIGFNRKRLSLPSLERNPNSLIREISISGALIKGVKMKKLLFSLCLITFSFASLTLGIAGGYKPIFQPLIQKFNNKYHMNVKAIYGPMGMLIFDANRNMVDAIIGDEQILIKHNKKIFYRIAQDKMVILSKKKINSLNNLQKMLLAVPNEEHTTYGRAAKEAFNNLHLRINKLIVSMMPQGINYLMMNQVQGAVGSLSQAYLHKNLKYFIIPLKSYKPIFISVAKIKNNSELNKFINFLKSKEVKEYLSKYGL